MKSKAERNLILISAAFLLSTALAMMVDSYLPGQTRAQAAQANSKTKAQCAAVRDESLVVRAATCMPQQLKRADTWVFLGVLGLGLLTIGAAIEYKRKEAQ